MLGLLGTCQTWVESQGFGGLGISNVARFLSQLVLRAASGLTRQSCDCGPLVEPQAVAMARLARWRETHLYITLAELHGQRMCLHQCRQQGLRNLLVRVFSLKQPIEFHRPKMRHWNTVGTGEKCNPTSALGERTYCMDSMDGSLNQHGHVAAVQCQLMSKQLLLHLICSFGCVWSHTCNYLCLLPKHWFQYDSVCEHSCEHKCQS